MVHLHMYRSALLNDIVLWFVKCEPEATFFLLDNLAFFNLSSTLAPKLHRQLHFSHKAEVSVNVAFI